jgi:peptidoglycan/LPS O-acetylase OafA/YrhL
MVGYYFSRRKFKHNIKTDNYKIFLALSSVGCLIGIPVQIYLEKLNLDGILLKFFYIYHDYIHAFLGITLTLIMLKVLPSIKNKVIDYLSGLSFHIYLVHQIFILGVFSLLNIKYGIILSIAVIFALSNILYFIFKYINSKVK